MTRKQKKLLFRILAAALLFAAAFIFEKLTDFAPYVYLICCLPAYFTAGYDVLIKCGKNIVHGQIFDEAFLMSLATAGALIIGEHHEAVFVMVFYQLGELFQSIAVGKTRRSISALTEIRPDFATVIRDGEETEVLPEEVVPGETVLVRPGDRIPIDGTVTKGVSDIDTSAVTGESIPVSVFPGDRLVSGSINLSGTLEYTADKSYADSTVAKILELVENSSFNKAKSEQFLTRFARYYTPAVVGAAVLTAVVPSVITREPSVWIYRALIFLVVSCPCALLISVPLSFFGGLGGASSKGVLIKGANYLEALADVSTVIFDKTGTLTDGTFEVTEVLPANGTDAGALLDIAARAEYYSPHPIGVSIKNRAPDCAPPLSAEELPGLGVKAETEEGTVLAGNLRLMAEYGIGCPAKDGSGSNVYVALNGRYIGAITVSDKIKPEAEAAVKSLRSLGIKKLIMLTGDNETSARAVAEKLGLDGFHAGLLPQDKAAITQKICEEAKYKEKTVFTGDGLNDAPVLALADVGVAMGMLGSDAAIEAADAVIMDDDPSKLAAAVKTARKTKRIVRENVIFALGVKLAVLVFAAFGLTNMWAGVIADVGVAVIAILNAMRCMK